MARGKKNGPKREFLSRTVKWEIRIGERPDLEQFLVRLSAGLREYEHWALDAQKENHEAYRMAKEAGSKPDPKSVLSDFDLYSRYMPLRQEDEREERRRAVIPANWVLESCFRRVSAAYKSFFALVARGDPDARTIRPSEEWQFVAIQGALNHGSLKGKTLILAPKTFPGVLEFPVPEAFQARMLANAVRLAKFVISRQPANLRQSGRYWLSVSYEMEKPEPVPFVPEEAVYIALGASSIGVISPRGEEVIQFWRSDKHWKPLIDRLDEREAANTRAKKGSRKWRKRKMARNRMFDLMAAQQTKNRREVVVHDLLGVENGAVARKLSGHGVHFVVTEYDVRSKERKLADASKPERRGTLGLNWSAQNTGSIGYLIQWLGIKVEEWGGSIRKYRLPSEALPADLLRGHENKILVAHALRDDFLKAYVVGAVT